MAAVATDSLSSSARLPGLRRRAAESTASGGLNLDGSRRWRAGWTSLRGSRSARLALETAGLQVCAEEQVVVVQMEDRPGVAAEDLPHPGRRRDERAVHVHRLGQSRRDRNGGPAEDLDQLLGALVTLKPEPRPTSWTTTAPTLPAGGYTAAMHRSLPTSVAVLLGIGSLAAAEPDPSREARWPGWRGSDGQGIVQEKGLPWSGARHETWSGRPRSPAGATPRRSCGATGSS